MNDFVLAVVFLVIALIFVVAVMYLLQCIFESIAIFRIMKQRNMYYPFLAWIPIARYYALGSVHDDIKREQGKISYFRFILPIFGLIFAIWFSYLILLVATTIINNLTNYNLDNIYPWTLLSPLMQIVAWSLLAVYLICLHTIFEKYAPGQKAYFICAMIFTIISIVPFIPGLLLMIVSKNNPAKKNQAISYEQEVK